MAPRSLTWLERVVAGIRDHADDLRQWGVSFQPHPKWHRKDRLTISDSNGRLVVAAHFRVRKDGTGLCFTRDDQLWHEAVMDGWDRRAAASALLTCAFLSAVPKKLQRGLLGMPGDEPISDVEAKPLQHKVRKSAAGWDSFAVAMPVNVALDFLKERHDQLTGVDVREKILSLEEPFRFLISKGVPFERIRQAWDEAGVAEVMKS